jgi:hydroxymethylpyrimidine pyrophosphatase-like HAD family hydrolase
LNVARASIAQEIPVPAPAMLASAPDQQPPLPHDVLSAELAFYRSYDWCLNPHPAVREAVYHLREEIERLAIVSEAWQVVEVATNVYLLSCGLLNCLDEHLRGPSLRLPGRLASMRVGLGARRAVEEISASLRPRHRKQVRRWREGLLTALDEFLSAFIVGHEPGRSGLVESSRRMATLLQSSLPHDVQAERIGAPSPFRRLDLTHVDVMALGRCFVSRFPDRSQPILLVGLRTSGSYFAPLLRAFLRAEGYESVALLTLEPSKGAGRRESSELKRCAARGYLAVIVDDPPHTAGTILAAFDIARRAGFGDSKLTALVPAHPARRDCFKHLPDEFVVSLPPEQWHKRALLEPAVVEKRLAEYFGARRFASTRVVTCGRGDELDDHLQSLASAERGARLKRIFEVELMTHDGRKQTRYVLAKSVGWGWLGYHAFLAGHRLADFVAPILGLRDGILYAEWIPQHARMRDGRADRAQMIDAAASYVAARVRELKLTIDSAAGIDLGRHQNGFRVLEKALSRAYGRVLTNTLMRSPLGRRLRREPCPFPTLIDGRMRQIEWIAGPHGALKTDYEHHGMGKTELNGIDPAYDLADTCLDLAVSPEEEERLIRRYVEESSDADVKKRLFLNKLLAGLWMMDQAQRQLVGGADTADAQRELHRRFMNAWNFLIVETARYCGKRCRPPAQLRWRAPLVALDVDGVLDRRLFGFPSTTAAGIEAISLLHAHEFSVALNTARSVAEVKDYCSAYSLAGGVAEHGSYIWDAVARRGRALVGADAMRQLAELKVALQRIPGVFLDDRHEYSLRAFTYRDKSSSLMASLMGSMRSSSIGDGALAPLPSATVQHLLADLRLDRLGFEHTSIDTAIFAKEVDKGAGLLALRDWVLGGETETVAIGDHEADLAMFRVATRSFAPSNIGLRYQGAALRLPDCAPNASERPARDRARACSSGPPATRAMRGERAGMGA